MASGDDPLGDAVSQIGKIVGKKPDLGKLTGAIKGINSAIAEFETSAKKFITNLNGLSKDLVAVQNANSKINNNLKLFGNVADQETFGLDAKKPDEKKKLDQAQKVLQKGIADAVKNNNDQNKQLDDLEKHLTHISSYKP